MCGVNILVFSHISRVPVPAGGRLLYTTDGSLVDKVVIILFIHLLTLLTTSLAIYSCFSYS